MIQNVVSRNEEGYDGISRAFHIEGFEDMPIGGLTFKNVSISCKAFGVINCTQGITFEDVKVSVMGMRDEKNDEYDNR